MDRIIKVVCFLVITVLVAVLVAAIWTSIPQLTEGWVIDKNFTAAHTTRTTSIVFTGKISVPITRFVHHPDTWRIHVSGTTEDGEERAEWWEIGETLYGMIEIGDWVIRGAETGVVERR